MSAVEKIQPVDQLPVAPAPTANPVMDMIRQAVAAGQPLDVIRELKDMAKELAADEARRAFDEALAAAKAEIPVIRKNRKVGYEHRDKSGETNYSHEDLGEIARTVDPILGKHGLSYRYRSNQGNGGVTVTCILSHRGGHFEETQLHAAPDNSGKKNAIQQTGSTITYLQRYTLKMALGLAAADDDDGQTSEQPDFINLEQVEALQALINETQSDVAKFCQVMKVSALPNIPANKFNDALAKLNAKKQRAAQ